METTAQDLPADRPSACKTDYSQSYVEFKVNDKTRRAPTAKYDPKKKSKVGNYYGFTCLLEPIQMASSHLDLTFGNDMTMGVYLMLKQGTTLSAYVDSEHYRNSDVRLDGGYLRVDVSRIFPDKLGDQVEIIGGDGNGDFWIKVSPLSYAYEVVDSGHYGDIGDNAMAALLRYYQAVVGYLNA